MKSVPNYYAILGAREDASPRELELLYKRAAHQHHPDRGGAEEDMKALNEAYQVLHNDESRRVYDASLRRPEFRSAAIEASPSAREVGVHGLTLSALLCLILGLMLLFLVRFNGLWFLWPLSILAVGVVLFGVLMAHSAMTTARTALAKSHPIRRLRVAQEIIFWLFVAGGGYAVYVILTWL